MATSVALLRAINLGARNRVPMARLREVLEEAGHEDVRTLLQSGNVVLSSPLRPPALGRRLEGELEAAFGFAIPVLVRTAKELADVVARDPLGDVAEDPRRYAVSFLSAQVPAATTRALEAADLGDERIVVSGRELYVWQPGGTQRSKLAKLLTDARLGVTSTSRNWSTVTKLLELAQG